MKTSTKIVIGFTVFIALVIVYGYQKTKSLVAIFEKMGIKPGGVSKIDVSLERVNFNLDIVLSNQSNEDFDVYGYGLVKLSEVKVYYDDVYLATSILNLTGITIPAKMNTIIEDVPVRVPKPLTFITNNLPLVYNMISNFDQNKITCKAIVDVAGQTIQIP